MNEETFPIDDQDATHPTAMPEVSARPALSLGPPSQTTWIYLTLDSSWQSASTWPPLMPVGAASSASAAAGYSHAPSDDAWHVFFMPAMLFFLLLVVGICYV